MLDETEVGKNEIIDVPVRDPASTCEFLEMSSLAWDAIEELVANMHAVESHTDINMRQVRGKRVEHEAFVEDLVVDVVHDGMPTRLSEGNPQLGAQERRRRRRKGERVIDELVALCQKRPLDHNAIRRDIADEGQSVDATIEQWVEDYSEQDYAEIDALAQRLRDLIPAVGTETLGVEGNANAAREHASAMSDALAELDDERQTPPLDDAASEKGWWPPFGRARAQEQTHTPDIQLVAECIATELCLRACKYAAQQLEDLLPPPKLLPDPQYQAGSEHGTLHRFELPADSVWRTRLQDAYLDAGDHGEGLRAVREMAEDRLPALINEAVSDGLHRTLAFDFNTKHTDRGRGVVVISPFAQELDLGVLRHLPDKNKKKVQQATAGATCFYHFQIIKRIGEVPALRDMVAQVEKRSTEKNDRRPYLNTAAEIWPLPLFELPGDITKEKAALLLAKAYCVKNALQLYENHLNVRSPGGNGFNAYDSFKRFCTLLTPRMAHRFHQTFWNETFAEDRSGTVTRIGRLAKGEIPSEGKRQRYDRMKAFVGATRWKDALATLDYRVQEANSDKYWSG